ncbi:hypothetical protein [Sporosarcina sp. FSL K6-1508]|uniref:hypothetical protein n=1 Tax=Sporosarcina sp. FSL K6-1508 TaxID=2921553 RepID=UPI0030FC4DA1
MYIEYIYAMQDYLNNLLLFKYLHDEGFDTKQYSSCVLSSYNEYTGSDDDGFQNFLTVSEHLFEIVEAYSSYDESQDDDKMYWLKQANACQDSLQSLIVVVILDPLLTEPITGDIGMSYKTGESGLAFQINDGVVILFDSDYGEIDWTETMYDLLCSRKSMLNREAKLNEMAI